MVVLRAATRVLVATLVIAAVSLGGFASDAAALSLVISVPVGPNPSWVSFDPNNRLLYVTNYLGTTVSVLSTDITDYHLVSTITTGSQPRSIALNLNTSRGYVVNQASKTLAVIDLTTNTVTATVSTTPVSFDSSCTATPWHVAVNPNTNLGYVTVTNCNLVDVFDLSTNPPQMIGTLSTSGTCNVGPLDAAINPNTNQVFVTVAGAAQCGEAELDVFDGNSSTSVDTNATTQIVVGTEIGEPDRLAINPATNLAYVSVQFDNTMSVIDTMTDTVIKTIPLPGAPDGVAIDQTRDQVYVGDLSSPYYLWQIDGGSNTIVNEIIPGTDPLGVEVNPSSGLVYTANTNNGAGNGTVTVVDMTGNVVPRSIIPFIVTRSELQ